MSVSEGFCLADHPNRSVVNEGAVMLFGPLDLGPTAVEGMQRVLT